MYGCIEWTDEVFMMLLCILVVGDLVVVQLYGTLITIHVQMRIPIVSPVSILFQFVHQTLEMPRVIWVSLAK